MRVLKLLAKKVRMAKVRLVLRAEQGCETLLIDMFDDEGCERD